MAAEEWTSSPNQPQLIKHKGRAPKRARPFVCRSEEYRTASLANGGLVQAACDVESQGVNADARVDEDGEVRSAGLEALMLVPGAKEGSECFVEIGHDCAFRDRIVEVVSVTLSRSLAVCRLLLVVARPI